MSTSRLSVTFSVPSVPAPGGAMVRACVAYDRSGAKLGDISIAAISDVLAQPDTFVWVGLHEPDEALLVEIQEEFGLHDLAIEDAHHAHQSPKLESYGDSLFIVLSTMQHVDGKMALGETHIFLGKRYLVSVRHGASLSYLPARQRAERDPELMALGPSFALYTILDFIVDQTVPMADRFHAELIELEGQIFLPEFRRHTIRRLYQLKKELVGLRLAIAPMQDILGQLIQLHPALIDDQVRPYFRDVQDHVIRVKESCDTISELLSAAMSVNLAMVTVGQNEVVKRLAGWAAIIAVPTLLASVYGMNFTHMPELHWVIGYPLALVGMFGIAGGLYFRLKRAGWL